MEISATVRGSQHLMAGESSLAASMPRASKNIGRGSSLRVCVMEISGSATSWFFFPSSKEHSGVSECPGTISESLWYSSAQTYGFFQDGYCEKSGKARCP